MTLRLNGDSSGFTEIKAPNAAGDNSITLPTSNGSANQLLQNGGTAGALQYTSAGDGLHYDSTGRLLVGTNTAPAGTDAQYSKLAIRGNTLNTNACYLSLGNRKTTTDTTSNDNLGIITFNDNDSDAGEYARIVGSASGNNAVNDYPGKLTFSTTGDGSSDPTPRIEINQTGALKLLAGCPGIDFSSIQTSAGPIAGETLDYYEEGSWTPASSQVVLSSITHCLYTKIGRQVTVSFDLFFARNQSANSSTMVEISGLPFTVPTSNWASGSCYFQRLQIQNHVDSVQVNAVAAGGTNKIQFMVTPHTSSFTNKRLTVGDISTSSTFCNVNLTYFV